MHLLRLSLRMLRRDWMAGELRILAFALIVAVGSMTTVGFFTDRVQMALSRQGNQLLGADLIIASDHPFSSDYADEATYRGLVTSTTTKFPSMAATGENSLLAEIKAVTAGYPLRGELRITTGWHTPAATLATVTGDSTKELPENAEEIKPAKEIPDQIAGTIPALGTVWVDDKLITRLSLQPGSQIEIGISRFTVAAAITQEPDYSIGFINLGPRILMNAADLPATGLIRQGSRISYRLLVAGNATAIEDFRQWAQSRLVPGERLEGIRDARPEIRSALDRAGKFLGLTALVSVVLAAAAIALAVRHFTRRHLDGCAVMRCLGASQGEILRLYLYHFTVLGLIASSIGCLTGFVSQEVLAWWLSSLVEAELPSPGLMPAVHGLFTGMILLLGFSLPPLLNLRRVPVLRVLRHDTRAPDTHSLVAYASGLAALSVLSLWQAGDLRLGLAVIGGSVIALALFGLLGFAFIRILFATRNQAGGTWRYGLASVRRNTMASVVQIVALGLGLMALLSLTLIRDDLLHEWRTSLPADAPNRFLVNIQPDQLAPLQTFFDQVSLTHPVFFPMIRGRLTGINHQTVTAENYPDTRARRLIEREFNLSWSDQMQAGNQLVKGQWWEQDDTGKAVLSIEEGIASTLNIGMGDVLTYDIAGSPFEATVTSIRKVNWDSFRVNFFVVTPPGVLNDYPATYITSFYLPPDKPAIISHLTRTFPNFLIIDVEAIITQVQKVIEQVTRAIEFVFLFTVLSGFAVLYAAIISTQDERLREAAIFRTLGASRQQLIRAWAAEFALTGGLAGLFAATGASVLGYVISQHLLNLPYTPNPWIILTGLLAGTAGVTLAGLAGTRSVLSHPPLVTLGK